MVYEQMGEILIYIFLGYFIIANFSAFNLFRIDKKKAKKCPEKIPGKKYDRISEWKLLKKCFLGGAIGGFFGMKIFRHKTNKLKFKIGVTLMLIMQIIVYSYIFGFFGYWVYLK